MLDNLSYGTDVTSSAAGPHSDHIVLTKPVRGWVRHACRICASGDVFPIVAAALAQGQTYYAMQFGLPSMTAAAVAAAGVR